ncbi:hypothetical protein, partial [Klebsiella pneumoniae]
RPLNKTKGCLIANFATVPKTLLTSRCINQRGAGQNPLKDLRLILGKLRLILKLISSALGA